MKPSLCVCGRRAGRGWGVSFLTRYDGELREPLVWYQESQVSMRVMRRFIEKTLMLGGIGGRRRTGLQRMRWLDGINDSMDMSLSRAVN